MGTSNTTEKLVYDIGSNTGKIIDFFLKEGYRVLAVDANLKVFEKCKKKYKDNPRVTLLNYAVASESNKVIDFYESDYSVVSTASLHWINNCRFAGKEKWIRIHAITITLDDLIKLYGVPDIIKVDVENFEFEVISGLHHKIPLVCFEYSEEVFDNAIKCVEHLKSIGYKLFSFTDRDSMKDYKSLVYKNWEELELHKDILPSRKHRWGMIYAK